MSCQHNEISQHQLSDRLYSLFERIIYPVRRQIYHLSTYEDGKQVTDYTNALGQKVATATVTGFSWWWPSYAVTMFKYDSHGNVKQVSNPNSQVSTYEYNYLNQIHQKTEPDGGSYAYAYNAYGQLVVEYNYKLWETYQARLFVYDDFGRIKWNSVPRIIIDEKGKNTSGRFSVVK